MENVGAPQFSGHTTDFQSLNFDSAIPKHKSFKKKPSAFGHFSAKTCIFALETDFWLNRTGSPHKCVIHDALNDLTISSSPCWKATLLHDATTNVLEGRCGITWVLGCIGMCRTLLCDWMTQNPIPKALRFCHTPRKLKQCLLAFLRNGFFVAAFSYRGWICEELMTLLMPHRFSYFSQWPLWVLHCCSLSSWTILWQLSFLPEHSVWKTSLMWVHLGCAIFFPLL